MTDKHVSHLIREFACSPDVVCALGYHIHAHTRSTYIDVACLILSQGRHSGCDMIGKRHLLKAVGDIVVLDQPLPLAYPQIPVLVGQYAADVVFGQRGAVAAHMVIVCEMIAIKPRQTMIRSNPDKTIAILANLFYTTARQQFRIIEPSVDGTCCQSDAEKTNRQENPLHTFTLILSAKLYKIPNNTIVFCCIIIEKCFSLRGVA